MSDKNQKYVNISVKVEVRDQLKEVVSKLRTRNSTKVTIAELVTQLAEAYTTQLDNSTMLGDPVWMLSGYPIIVNSDGAKHYNELKQYEPVFCSSIVSDLIRQEAMKRRLERVTNAE